MSEKPQKSDASDYSKTLFLPQTEFPMRAGLPQREPEILKRWNEIGLYARLRENARGQAKFVLHGAGAMVAFRKEGRAYAGHWLNVQREEFKRLGIIGDWDHPYATMDYFAEAQIAREQMKFAANGTLYRGSKPVMWSVVEKTALAEAEVEYEDFTSDMVWVKFRIDAYTGAGDVAGASVVIWTTTPWTLPGNRAI